MVSVKCMVGLGSSIKVIFEEDCVRLLKIVVYLWGRINK
ncbi:hypothetical protein M084_3761 [Bacteroides fragilis str. 3988 T1]|nr:hypothetical protein M084_3761 [Bacteroides fragilis str. 3988 T1]